MDPNEWTPQEWLIVRTDTAESARLFFGAPPGWPVKFAGFNEDQPGRIWKVLAKGLTVK
jgi:hypothetical protein